MRQWPSPARDPLLIGAVLWTALAAALFFGLAGPSATNALWQVRTLWLVQVPLDGLLVYSSWRVFRIATGATRRFWRILGSVTTLFLFGDSFQALQAVLAEPGDSSTTSGGVLQSACFVTGLAAVVLAMLAHPQPGRSARERLAFWLDSATVLVGGAVIAWSFAVKPGEYHRTDILGTLALSAVSLTSAFAAVKMIMGGNAPMRRAAAIPMITAAGFVMIGQFVARSAADHPPAYVYLVRLLPSLLIAVGPRIQELIARFDPEPFGERRRRHYSVLPYGAMAVAFLTLVVIMPNGAGIRMWGVVAGLGAICLLVVLRQVASFRDNTDLINRLDATLAELSHQAHTDGLTGLANRTHFYAQLETALGRTSEIAVLLVDLDGFKAVNDTLGHAAGDTLLVSVADKMRAALRSGDVAARLGGDEFAVLLHDCTGPDAEDTARRILEALAVPVEIDGTSVRANASIGAAAAEPGEGSGALVRRADIAMYAAKSAGKGRWKRYEAGMETAASSP
ncbi:GGDEF domain-containing protein [Actinoplanes sp. KI2]|uniref:GGDEF domain-containing protein n=1 Tax=Actinoplanes sp. KI2 TaxID=2983315 RepID=UPI0021D60400|nr:GGDEF domain-containing protein [Actinoplanes sp. KI2]MCU7728582.1 GGDEF domain-containing protein [Actinoplanes sp. KI2]